MKKTIIVMAALGVAVSMAAIYFLWPPGKINVVLISIDTLRHDHLGCYGYQRATSPSIDRLASEGAVFETAVSTTSWTLPAHAALLTSLPDPVHRVLWDTDSLDPERVTMAEIFKRNGYRVGAVFSGPYLLPRFGLDQGFDRYMDATIYDKELSPDKVLVASEKGRTTPGAIDQALDWIKKDPERPFFLFLHLFDAHPDFDPPPPYDRMFDPDYRGNISGQDIFHNPAIKRGMDEADLAHLVALYDGEIRFVDEAGVKRLIDFLAEEGLIGNTLIVITADHGEEFFEHGRFGHRFNLFDTTVRIPLIFWKPGLVPGGVRLKGQAGIIDVMPTVLGLAGLEGGEEMLGRDLTGLIKGEDAPDPAPLFLELTGGSIHLEGIRTEEKKLVVDHKTERVELFDLAVDPEERVPAGEGDGALKEMLGQYRAILKALAVCGDSIPWSGRDGPGMDAETRQRLESLGYLDK